MIDPRELMHLSPDERREAAFEALSRECLRTAEIIGSADPLYDDLLAAARDLAPRRHRRHLELVVGEK